MKQLLGYSFLLVALLATPYAYGQKMPGRWMQSLQAAKNSPKQLQQVLTHIQQENLRLRIQNEQTRTFQTQLFQTVRPAVFRALPPKGQGAASTYTGTVFQTEYNGQPEIYGAIAMHTLKDTPHIKGLLSYKFTALVETEGRFKTIPAWVVQLSSSKMGDVALVKFRAEDQALLTPLLLAQEEPAADQPVYVAGYARNLFTRQALRADGHTSTGLLRTRIAAAQEGDRAGFCGSPLVNSQAELTAIHIGSTYQRTQPQTAFTQAFGITLPAGDTGYAVPGWFLRSLVEAYHAPDKPVWPVLVNGTEITRLAPQEYIARTELLDANHRVLWQADTDVKMTLRPLETALSFFKEAKFIRLVIGKTHWQNENRKWVVANDDTPQRVVLIRLEP